MKDLHQVFNSQHFLLMNLESYGYLMNDLSKQSQSICPPDKAVWEILLLARAQEALTEVVIDQILSLATGLVQAISVNNLSSNIIVCRMQRLPMMHIDESRAQITVSVPLSSQLKCHQRKECELAYLDVVSISVGYCFQ